MLPHASVSLCWSEPIKDRELSYQSQSGLGISITSQPCLETGYSEARDTQKRVTESELLFAPEPVRTKDQIVEKEFVAYHFIVLEKFQKFLKSHQISCNKNNIDNWAQEYRPLLRFNICSQCAAQSLVWDTRNKDDSSLL
jgi:hypothetical protein